MAPSCRFAPLGPIGLITQENDNAGRQVCSGRVTAIAIHPTDTKTVYVGTAGGGVWKTTDAGLHWRALTDRQWTLSIGAIAIDPSHPDRVYVGTGEANITDMAFVSEGLLASADAGVTWSKVPLPSTGRALTKISRIVVSKAGERVFVGTDAGLFLLRPEQPPATQVTVLDADPVSDLVFDDAGGRLFIAKRSQGMALWNDTGAPKPLGRAGDDETKKFPNLASLMKGKTQEDNDKAEFRLALAWIPQEADTLFVAIAKTAGSPGTTFLHSIVRSDDAGTTWTPVAGPADEWPEPGKGIFAEPQATYNLLFARDPLAPSTLFIGLTWLYRSTSLGSDWRPKAFPPPARVEGDNVSNDDLHADQHTIAFASTGEIWLGNDGGVWRSRTRGETWYHRNRGLATMQLYHGGVDVDVPGLIMAGAQDNGFQEFDGHPVWQSAEGGDVGMVALDTRNERIWIATTKGVVDVKEGTDQFRSVPIPTPPEYSLFFSPFAIAPSDPDVVYLGTTDLFHIDADRTTWLPVPEYAHITHGPVSAIAVSPAHPGVLYVAGMRPGVARIEKGFPAVDLQLPPEPDNPHDRFISDLAISPRDDNRLYVVIGEQMGGPRPYRRRLYRCDASSRSWTDLTDNLPWFDLDGDSRPPGVNPVHAVVIDPDPGVTDPALEHVYIGCDRGVFRSWNGGDSWELIDHGLPLAPVYDLRFQQSTRRLLAFTHGRGTWMRAADVEPCAAPPTVKEVELYLRDERYDIGLAPSPLELPDPLDLQFVPNAGDDRPAGDDEEGRPPAPPPPPPVTRHWTDGIDLKIDRETMPSELRHEDEEPSFQDPASTLNYAQDGPLDGIGFEALVHRAPNPKAPARVYLQVHNRGPDEAANVVARLYWAAQAPDGSYPDLPAGFWSQYPAGDPGADSAWQPVGPASIVPSVRPAEPEIVPWTWNVPANVPPRIGLLAIVTSADDPVDEGQPPDVVERKIERLVRNNRRVLLKTSDTVRAAVSSGRSWGWLKWVGLAAGVGVAAAVLYEEME